MDVLQDIINNKPCLSPNEMTEDQLLMDLVQQGRNTSGSREDMVSRLMDQYLGPKSLFFLKEKITDNLNYMKRLV